jgi:Flp pilus assembly protein TadD
MSEEMIDVLGGKIQLPQKEAATLLEAGYLLMELEKATEAEEVFDGVASLLPHSDVPHVALGTLYASQGRWQQALKAHKKALAVKPDSALAMAHMGEVLLFMKKPVEAVEQLQAAQVCESEDSSAAEYAKTLLEAHEMGVFES